MMTLTADKAQLRMLSTRVMLKTDRRTEKNTD